MCSLARKPSSASDVVGAELPPCMSRYPTSALSQPAFRSTHPLLASEYDNMLACIRCGLCLTSCPTYVLTLHESEGPRGRVGMARAVAEGHLQVTPDLLEHELNCLVCDACSAVCPAGVHMDPLQVVLRSAIEPEIHRSWGERLLRRLVFSWLFMDMARFRVLARLLWLYQRSGVRWLARRLRVLDLLGLAEAERLLPDVPRRFFTPRGESYPSSVRRRSATAAVPAGDGAVPAGDSAGLVPEGDAGLQVSIFAGCVMSTALADIDRATLRVLRRAGFTVRNPAEQGCCGALHAHGGDLRSPALASPRSKAVRVRSW
ncbi:MAG: 4Fe-4S dicluster domain-containing protein [Chloroflexi bacterium]|nr:MAG: 4Fe-4S dicluster domain-containing protein [Chloroflexota bacterium]